MSNVITFTPRPRAPLPPVLPPLAGIDLRAHLEEAAQTALDAADKIIAALDRIEVADDETDPRLTAMAAHAGQVVQVRETPAPVEPKPEANPHDTAPADPEVPESQPEEPAQAETPVEPIRLPWRGAGNVVSAAGCAILALVGAA